MKITVSIVTRGAAPYLDTVIRAYTENATDLDNVRIVVASDNDDPAWDERIDTPHEPHIIYSRALREDYLGAKWNRALRIAPADIYVMTTDDTGILTKGWDAKLRESAALFQDGVGVLYFGEAQGAVLPMVQAVTHGWADGFGGLFCEHFPYWFVDMWLHELATMTQRVLWVDIAGELVGGRGKTKGLRDLRFWNDFFDRTRPLREYQADRAIDELYKGQPYRVAQLRGRLREVALASFSWSSQYIQQTSAQQEGALSIDAPEDDRYLRIKAKANAYMESLYKKAA